MWPQNYDPLGSAVFSTLAAALPAVALLGCIALRVRVHFAALAGLFLALIVAVGLFHMPGSVAASSVLYGVGLGLFPIGWIILNIVFLYQLTVKRGHFEVLRESLAAVAPDARVQVILIAFAFGAFLEGMAGFGAPIAITAAILIELGFKPFQAASLALIANTAPVAFGSLGIPVTTLAQVTGLDVHAISAMVGRQLPFFSLFLPFWIVALFAGWRGMLGVWPAALVAGVCFAVPQYLISNFHGPWLVDIISGVTCMGGIVVLLRYWRPRILWGAQNGSGSETPAAVVCRFSGREVMQAWTPWILLTAVILVWGTPLCSNALDKLYAPKVAVPYLHGVVQRVPPIASAGAKPEAAEFKLNVLSASGTGILLAGLAAGSLMGFSPRRMVGIYGETLRQLALPLMTIATMLAFGMVIKYSGLDATLGLALAHTGVLYPFFGTLLGWLGVALTGSDTSSNVLFGSLQRITAEQIGISPILMCAANTSGGVMGKMIAAQSIVVASAATNWYGHEGKILRFVFWHSLALASLVGIWVLLQAYVYPFTEMVVK
ncbi:L-lactate permease [soil metagenome]